MLTATPPATAEVSFRCNVCGADCRCPEEALGRESASCSGCGSTVRMRAVVHLLSEGLFGESLALPDFPVRKDLRGAGLSDWGEYARRLAERLDYTNTYFHQAPQLDITRIAPEVEHSCDFLISTDVFEHVEPPVSRAFEGARRLLKPGGLLVLTVPYSIENSDTVEHYPDLHDWKLVQGPDGGYSLENVRRDGQTERFPDPIFHGGPGTTLEMRVFSRDSLLRELEAAGFRDVRFADEPVPAHGIVWPVPWGLPVVARAPDAAVEAKVDAEAHDAAAAQDPMPFEWPAGSDALAEEFLLEAAGDHRLREVLPIAPRWIDLPHAPEITRCLAMIPGEVLSTPWLVAPEEAATWLKIARGLPEISADGLEAEIWLCPEEAAPRRHFAWRLDNDSPRAGKAGLVLPLPLSAGQRFRLELRCGPGPAGDPSADWLAVVEWAVSSETRLPLLRARSHAQWRLQNELAHFENAYRGEIYRHREVTRRDDASVEIRDMPAQDATLPGVDVDALRARAAAKAPTPGESSYVYAHRLMFDLLDQQRPQFANRLSQMHARLGRPLRMLSLCAGEAKVEADLLARADVPVELVLVDVNDRLLQRAASGMPPSVRIDCLRGSATDITPAMGLFDIINITSGLHHLVELETVLAAIATMLTPAGEFWLIGEQVGRNGNRLWPDAREAADAVFATWPEAKRRNAGTGRIDPRLPDTDCASGTFEGIRSEDIEAGVARHFLPVSVVVADAFLWRLMDGTYASNFDLSEADDLALVREAVVAEVRHWLEGGRGTALHGAYRAKRGRPPA